MIIIIIFNLVVWKLDKSIINSKLIGVSKVCNTSLNMMYWDDVFEI